MKVACVLIPHFWTAVEQRDDPGLIGHPIIVVERGRVGDVSAEAEAQGVRAGMLLRQAQSLCPTAVRVRADEARYTEASEALRQVLGAFSPIIEVAGPGCVYLEVSGLERRRGDDRQLAESLQREVQARMRLIARVGIGPNKFVAWAAARTRPGGTVVRPGQARALVRDLSIDHLPLSAETRRRLGVMGIHTCGQLANLPGHAVAAQFGAEGQRAQALARGQDDRPLTPCRPPLRLVAHCDLDAVADGSILRNVAGRVLRTLQERLARRGLSCQEIRLTLRFDSGEPWEEALTLREPAQGLDKLGLALAELLQHAAAPGPVVGLDLKLYRLTAMRGRQLDLFVSPERQDERLRQVVRDLARRYGGARFRRAYGLDPSALLLTRRFAWAGYLEDDQTLGIRTTHRGARR